MENNSTNIDYKILDHIGPSVLGIIWTTNQELNSSLKDFSTFNYLLNGLLTDYILDKNGKLNSDFHLFYTENFGNRIFLAHLKNSHLHSKLNFVLENTIRPSENQNHIVMFGTENSSVLESILSKYKDYRFNFIKI